MKKMRGADLFRCCQIGSGSLGEDALDPPRSLLQSIEFIRSVVAAKEVVGKGRGEGGALSPPEVVGELLLEAGEVGDELGIEEGAGLEGAILEDALTETVDGMDRRLVEVDQRPLQATPGIDFVGRTLPQWGKEVIAAGAGEVLDRFDQATADAVAQFGGRCFGEGDDEDLFDLQPLFDDQAHHQSSNGVGLAGPGARLNEDAAGDRAGEEVKVRVAHASPSPSFPAIRRGRKICSASAVKAAFKGSSRKTSR